VVALTFQVGPVRLRQDGIDLAAVEVQRLGRRPLLERNVQHGRAMGDCLRLALGDEAVEAAQRGQAAVARTD